LGGQALDYNNKKFSIRASIACLLVVLLSLILLNAPWLYAAARHQDAAVGSGVSDFLASVSEISDSAGFSVIRNSSEALSTDFFKSKQTTRSERILVVGDSLAEGLGVALRSIMVKESGIPVDINSRLGSSWGDSYMQWWENEIEEALRDYGLIVLSLGPPYSSGAGRLFEGGYEGEEWGNWWEDKLLELISLLPGDAKVFFLGRPAVGEPELSSLWDSTNSVYAKVLQEKEFELIKTWELVGSTSGDVYNVFSPYVVSNDKRISVRDPDMVHFTPEGYELLARDILKNYDFSLP